MAETMPDEDGFGSDFKRICGNRIPNPPRIAEVSHHMHRNLFPRAISKETWKVPEEDFEKALRDVEKLIEGEWAVALAMPLDDGQARFVSQYLDTVTLNTVAILNTVYLSS